MELENLRERNQQIHSFQILFEDFFKNVANLLCNDAEILILEYLIDKSKEGELEIPDEKMPFIFRFDKNTTQAALIRLSKSKLIEIKERLRILNTAQNTQQNSQIKIDKNNFKPEKKPEKIYRLNRKLLEEFPPILEKFKRNIEHDLSFNYVCRRCNRNYKSEEVFITNPTLEAGKFRCKDTSCSSYLHELTELEIKASDAKMRKVKEVVQIIQEKFDAIKDKEWPFKRFSLDRNLLKMNANDRSQNNPKQEDSREAKLEENESSKESWWFKSFKTLYSEKFGKEFDYLQFLVKNKLPRSQEIIKKLEEGKKKSQMLQGFMKKRLTQQIILGNRKRFGSLIDSEYDKLYKSLKK